MNKAASRPQEMPILVVDDDPGQRSLLQSFLGGQGFPITSAASGEEALGILETTRVAMLISDIRMPGISGLQMLRRVRTMHPHLPVLLVTAYADIRDAVNAMRDGAVNYLEKPIDLDELLASVRQTVGIASRDPALVTDRLVVPAHVIVESAPMREVLRQAALAAPSETRILITGESGVGKEVVADLIHGWSARAARPLVKVNCAAIPEPLLESELFGHERGSFTGASAQRIGRFEEADGGTILLDEIAEMSPMLQSKLLRVTQDGSFQRVGSNRERRTNVRILAATNRNLEKEVEAARFREDLFFRLNVMEIYVPALRERPEDVVALATHFAAQFSRANPRLSASTIQLLQTYEWPGNVRELRNAIERATLMARGDVILPEHFPTRVRTPQRAAEPAPGAPAGTSMEDIERAAILRTLREHNFNRSETARVLGISRRALIYKLQRYNEQGHPVASDQP
jgi:DNA-binding NtrC family response regulator